MGNQIISKLEIGTGRAISNNRSSKKGLELAAESQGLASSMDSCIPRVPKGELNRRLLFRELYQKKQNRLMATGLRQFCAWLKLAQRDLLPLRETNRVVYRGFQHQLQAIQSHKENLPKFPLGRTRDSQTSTRNSHHCLGDESATESMHKVC